MDYIQGNFLVQGVAVGAMIEVTLLCPEVAAVAKAGQFVHLRVPGFFLRRPISICAIDTEGGRIRILFDIRGEGTRALAQVKAGDRLDMMGPLGNGFTVLEEGKKAVFVGGGIGVPPLLQLAKEYGGNGTAILGFRDRDKIVLTDAFLETGGRLMLATDDGSAGHRGFVTDLLRQRLAESEAADIVYACGPTAMLRAVAACCAEFGVRCQVSLEERMGCGVGACLVCACKTTTETGQIGYTHLCKHGPVFEAERVIFDDESDTK